MLHPGYKVNQENTCISPIPECRRGKKSSRRTRVWKMATSEKCLLSKSEDPSPNPQQHTQKTADSNGEGYPMLTSHLKTPAYLCALFFIVTHMDTHAHAHTFTHTQSSGSIKA